MPVKFYPERPIDLLEKYIVKADGSPLQGEIDIYRRLHSDLSADTREWYVWHDLKLPNHADSHNPYRKTSSQIDFLVLSNEGILVLEVKGGPISYRNNIFYYGKDFNEEMPQDPFRQSEGYKYTLKEKILSGSASCCFCHAVAFPHVDYPFETSILDSHLFWTKKRSASFGGSLLEFILSVFQYTKAQHGHHSRRYQELGIKDIDSIKRILSPTIKDRSKLDVPNTLEWLQINNLEILDGLSRNRRIMIEGPPGSGKTTIAKAFIDQQNNKFGIYLCWNNLLMHYTKKKLGERKGLENVEVLTLSRFLMGLSGQSNTADLFALDEAGFRAYLKEVVGSLEKEGKLPSFDYIVVDEGQDIFDRGVDIILEKMCGYGRNGLTDGNILLLYDIDQGYSDQSRNVLGLSHLLSEYFAHFRLNKIRRSAQKPAIQKLASAVLEARDDLNIMDLEEENSGIGFSKHSSLEEVKRYLVTNLLSQIRDTYSSMRGGKCVLLIESSLLREQYLDEPGMNYWLTIKDVEEITENNVADESNKLRYTSILRFKGLEKEIVFLIVTKLCVRNRYEWFVGITRAISNLQIMILDR